MNPAGSHESSGRHAAVEIPSDGNGSLLTVRELHVHFPLRGGILARGAGLVKAVDGVSFSLSRGRTLGLIGESGCGKTTLGRAVLRLVPAVSGNVHFDGVDLLSLSGRRLRRLRPRMQMVFQDAAGSLDPRMRVEQIVGEPLAVHGVVRRGQRRGRVAKVLERVDLGAEFLSRYPHELSGGQRQRVGIARAVALKPDFIVLDEPVSALDVSIQGQIINLLADLQAREGLSYLFIAHNPAVVSHISHAVAVMYLGKLVETGPAEEVFAQPRHPYTRLLLRSSSDRPGADTSWNDRRPDPLAEPPSVINPPGGCSFHPRCPMAVAECRVSEPVLRQPAGCGRGHLAACHLADAPSGPAVAASRGP